MKKVNIVLALGAVILVGIPGISAAQSYKWRDQNGVIVYSDKPPPPNIPPGNILQKPKLNQAAPESPAPAKSAEGKAAPGPKSIAEREADYKKRQAADQKKAKEEGEKSAQEEQRLANCKSLRENLAALESGQRMTRMDEKGERVFINDEERARDITKAREQMTSSKCS